MKVLLYAAFRRDRLELRLDVATGSRFLAVIAAGSHPFPYRTRQLSPPAPMVVGPQGPSRVGRRQDKQESPLGRIRSAGFLVFSGELFWGRRAPLNPLAMDQLSAQACAARLDRGVVRRKAHRSANFVVELCRRVGCVDRGRPPQAAPEPGGNGYDCDDQQRGVGDATGRAWNFGRLLVHERFGTPYECR
jgi:hypothetical protein